jgi:hypothetical protein
VDAPPSIVAALQTKKVEGVANAWQKALVPADVNPGALFEKGKDAAKKPTSPAIYVSDQRPVLAVLSVAPLLECLQELVGQLAPYTLAASLRVAFLATRVMQYIVARKWQLRTSSSTSPPLQSGSR